VKSVCRPGWILRRPGAGPFAAAFAVALALAGCSGSSATTPAASRTPGPSLGPGHWVTTGSLAHGRDAHTATQLGKAGPVLIAGGYDAAEQERIAEAELYEPASGTFRSAGTMLLARDQHTATWLPKEGLVLLAGGRESYKLTTRVTATAELYDPAAEAFTATGSMSQPRTAAAAVLLKNGKVLVVGGASDDGALSSAELYNPETGTFSPTGSMAEARQGPSATLLEDGRVLVAGGSSSEVLLLSSAEIYDPGKGEFEATGSMTVPRRNQTATLLYDGRVLIAGGDASSGRTRSTHDSAEVYDPEAGAFSPTGSMSDARVGHTATALPDGRVLVVGGSSYPTAELYHPWSGDFSSAGNMAESRSGCSATLLDDGSVLVVGGLELHNYVVRSSAELWLPL
jgi:hypothetical protein